MIVYQFNILSLTKKTVNNVKETIISVLWERVGFDSDGNNGSYKVVTSLDTSAVGSNTTFIDYNKLTKQNVIEWIKTIIDEDDVNRSILEEIQRSKDKEISVSEDQFPWILNT